MSGTVQANDGAMLPLDSLAQQLTYSGGFISQIQVQYQGNIYNQTFMNDGTNITYISGWNNPDFPATETIMTTESGDIMLTEDGNLMITE